MKFRAIAASVAALLLTGSVAGAATTLFDVGGKGGTGLLASNENHVVTGAFGSGGEVGSGISYDDLTNVLSINIGWGSSNGFTDLTANAAAGHIHGPTTNGGMSGFTQNAGVRIGLDSLAGWNGNAAGGGFVGAVTLDATQEAELLAERFYINVHTPTNSAGEIRGHLVVVPEPAGAGLLVGAAGFLLRRRRAA